MVLDNSSHDLVARNDILKSQEILEDKARKEWNQKWGFYLNFDKICLEEARKRGYTEREYRNIAEKRKSKQNLEDDIWIIESSADMPKTSTGYVGWRSTPNYSLEKIGPLYISPRHTLPYEPPYSCIMLG